MTKGFFGKFVKDSQSKEDKVSEENQIESIGKDNSPQCECDLSEAKVPKQSLTSRARRAFQFGKNSSKNEEMDKDMEQVDERTEVENIEDLVVLEHDKEVNESELEEVENICETLRKEVSENYDKYLRAVAELENYKKRAVKERSELLRYSGEYLARDILPVVDDLERAMLQGQLSSAEDLLGGVRMIADQLVSVLNKHSIRSEDALGQMFDPSKHEALASVPSEGHEPGTIIDQLKKPYFFKDKLIRPGQVVVSAKVEKDE